MEGERRTRRERQEREREERVSGERREVNGRREGL